MDNAFEINSRLLSLYGRDTIYDQPNWRVVWSDTLVEKRDGVWEDITPSGIYLGTKKGIREVKKYDYLKPCWVLEKFHPVFTRGTHDEVREPYTFEPIYVFLDKMENNLPLNWRAVEVMVLAWTYQEHQFFNQQQMKEMAEKKEKDTYDAEVAQTRDIIEQDDPKEQPTFKSSVYVKEETK